MGNPQDPGRGAHALGWGSKGDSLVGITVCRAPGGSSQGRQSVVVVVESLTSRLVLECGDPAVSVGEVVISGPL